MGEGDELQWHFDQTDFVVSLALQDADEGGDFEVAPFIRTADDEHYDDVARVLAGDRESLDGAADDARHAARVRGPALDAPGLADHGADARASSGCSATTPQPGTMSSELLKAVRYGRVSRDDVLDRRGFRGRGRRTRRT